MAKMVRITPEIIEYIKKNIDTSNRNLTESIAKKYGLTFNQSTIGRHKNKLKQAAIAPVIAPPKVDLQKSILVEKVPKVVPRLFQIPLIQAPPLSINPNDSDWLRAQYKLHFGKSSRKESKSELAAIFCQVYGQVKEELSGN